MQWHGTLRAARSKGGEHSAAPTCQMHGVEGHKRLKVIVFRVDPSAWRQLRSHRCLQSRRGQGQRGESCARRKRPNGVGACRLCRRKCSGAAPAGRPEYAAPIPAPHPRSAPPHRPPRAPTAKCHCAPSGPSEGEKQGRSAHPPSGNTDRHSGANNFRLRCRGCAAAAARRAASLW